MTSDAPLSRPHGFQRSEDARLEVAALLYASLVQHGVLHQWLDRAPHAGLHPPGRILLLAERGNIRGRGMRGGTAHMETGI